MESPLLSDVSALSAGDVMHKTGQNLSGDQGIFGCKA
jgi:hypothetical protein